MYIQLTDNDYLQAFERCEVRGGFNLSFESLTSAAALRVLRELPRSDPELWVKISGDDVASDGGAEDEDDEDGGEEDDSMGDDEGREDREPVFGDEDGDEDDTSIEPAALMARMLRIPVVFDQVPGEADGLEPDGVIIPDPDSMGRGKRRKTATKQYNGYAGH